MSVQVTATGCLAESPLPSVSCSGGKCLKLKFQRDSCANTSLMCLEVEVTKFWASELESLTKDDQVTITGELRSEAEETTPLNGANWSLVNIIGVFVVTADKRREKAEWLQIRKEAALEIDAETAEVSWHYGDVADPYGGYTLSPGEPYNVGRNYFACAPGSEIWVSFHDLPLDTVKALQDRPPSLDAECTFPF